MREIAQGLLRAPGVTEQVQDKLSGVMQRLIRMSHPLQVAATSASRHERSPSRNALAALT
jgi:hypothetical protein